MTTEIESKPQFPPFTRETAMQKIRMAEDVGTVATRSVFHWCTRQIRNGATVRSFPKGVRLLWSF